MKKYKVIANGVEYEVEIELMSDDGVKAEKTEKAPEAKPAAPAPVSDSDNAVKAPLTGIITTVSVKDGDAVKKGQVLMILEAMKMENEILSPSDCVVKKVSVSAGAQVSAGDVLCVLG